VKPRIFSRDLGWSLVHAYMQAAWHMRNCVCIFGDTVYVW